MENEQTIHNGTNTPIENNEGTTKSTSTDQNNTPSFAPRSTFAHTKTPKEQQLGIFKKVVLQMLEEGKTEQEIVTFAENPTPINRYGREHSSDLELAFFGGIGKYTTKEDRLKVLEEIE